MQVEMCHKLTFQLAVDRLVCWQTTYPPSEFLHQVWSPSTKMLETPKNFSVNTCFILHKIITNKFLPTCNINQFIKLLVEFISPCTRSLLKIDLVVIFILSKKEAIWFIFFRNLICQIKTVIEFWIKLAYTQ